jgi:outer membrane immunogenic protein
MHCPAGDGRVTTAIVFEQGQGDDMNTIRLAMALAGALLAAPASAADFPRKAPILTAETVNWGGFYVGIHAGFGTHEVAYPFSVPLIPLTGENRFDIDGAFGGGQVGYNMVIAPGWLVGVEVDIAWSDINGGTRTTVGPLDLITSTDLRWFGTARGRLARTFDRAMIYVTGGYAFGKSQASANLVGVFVGTQNHNKSGWTVGGGLEYAWTANLSFKAEYLYIHFGTDNVATLPGVFTADEEMNLHTAKIGLNWRFAPGRI